MPANYRRCVSCRKLDHRSAFWRVVRVFPSQQVQLDQGMGRSVYLCPQESCLQSAQKKDRLGRSLKTSVPGEVYQLLWQRLAVSGKTSGQIDPATPDQANSKSFKGATRDSIEAIKSGES